MAQLPVAAVPTTLPVLKWLAEKRARIADTLDRTSRRALALRHNRTYIESRLAIYQRKIDLFERRRHEADLGIARAEDALKSYADDLFEFDKLIVSYDVRVDPSAIDAINGWKGKYGLRGALRRAVLDLLGGEAPRWTPTAAINAVLRAQFQVPYATAAERRHWHDSLKTTLNNLRKDGLVEKTLQTRSGKYGFAAWRPRQTTLPTLAQLRDAANET